MATVHYTAKVQDKRLLELPEEADELELQPGDEVEVNVQMVRDDHREQTLTPQERAKAYREWAESHSRALPLLSDEAISRESIYGENA